MTDRSGSDEALALAAIALASGDAVIANTVDGVVTVWNEGANAVYGYTDADMIGRNIAVTFPPEDLAAERERQKLVTAGTAEISYRCRRLCADGTTVDVNMSMAPVRDDGGNVVGVASISRPVSDAERADARFLALMEAAPDPMVCVDSGGVIVFVNTEACTTFDYGRDELIGAPVELLVPEDVRIRHVGHRARFLADPHVRHMGIGTELLARRRDGATFPVEVSLAADVQSGETFTIAAVRDVTDRRDVEARLRASEISARAATEAKNQFLARMSHELRTPLNAILGFGQVLEHRLADTPHATQVGQVLRAGRHLLDLVNEVLDIARIESGDMAVSVEAVCVAAIIDESTMLMRPAADAANVTLTVVAGPPAAMILADLQRLRQILLNLLSNAIKYNSPGGNVWVSWTDIDSDISIEVRDDGPGIPTGLQYRLFTPFDRLGAETTGIEGSGVGLTVTRALVELMDGSLTFTSEHGTGTVFTVTLRAGHEPGLGASLTADESTAPDPSSEASATVLYIEDNEPNVRVMESIIELRPEWTMIHAATGSLGRELAQTHHPDLVLLDLNLPEGSGLDVLRSLRSHPATTETPVVILSADASRGQIRRMLEEGADQYLTKPVSLRDVLALLDSVNAALPLRSEASDA